MNPIFFISIICGIFLLLLGYSGYLMCAHEPKPFFTAVKLFLLEYALTIMTCVLFYGITLWNPCKYQEWGENCDFFLLPIIGMFLIPFWFIASIFLMAFEVISEKRFAIQVTLLSVTFFVTIPLTDYVMDYVEQRELKDLIEKIEIYQKQQGVFPAQLADVGKFYQGRQVFYKLSQKPVPILTYFSTTLCQCQYIYNFQEHTWGKKILD